MSAYITVEQVKDAIGIKGSALDTVDDNTLATVIFRASAMVDAYLDSIRPGYVGFAAGSNYRSAVGSNTRTYHGTGTDTIFIDDADSVASVTVLSGVSQANAVPIIATAYVVEPLNTKPKRWITYVLPFTSVTGLLPSVWSPGTANIQVVAYWGLPTVPDDIALVTLSLSVLIWQRYQDGLPPPAGPSDPEIMGILSNLDWAWRIDMIGGAGVSFGGVAGGGATSDYGR